MNVFVIILQAASGSSETQWSGIVMMIVIVAIFYFVMQVIKKSKKKDEFIQENNDLYNVISNVNQKNEMNMNEEIKCPQCGGNKTQDAGYGTYKCMYCGTTFKPVSTQVSNNTDTPVASTPTAPSPQIINVNVGNTAPRQQSSVSDSFAKGAAGASGAVAGGCLTYTAIIIGVPFILFLLLLSMCS